MAEIGEAEGGPFRGPGEPISHRGLAPSSERLPSARGRGLRIGHTFSFPGIDAEKIPAAAIPILGLDMALSLRVALVHFSEAPQGVRREIG